MKITKDTSIEELTEQYSFAVKYLSEKGIRCIVCGEPIWGTLEEACKEKNFSDEDINAFVKEMNEIAKSDSPDDKPEQSIDTGKINL
jgi:methionine synthase II (cobalamin-independent)